ncbi:peroxiredoxin [Microbacterium barkeri]|uniref:Peroxiredoxin n=1 Tax=Microbacterium barkeri TaxID=33917 RepID=A0A9W6H1D3_9MICO|nr:OsmC family protein [Microbacterium barkeri]MDR6875347.1 organic hydroperoxide reductase OsmC/OhrA [Microbacterium barkeri]GLJ60487.1 peroxiredoxin [Microbacterium barkeri]
MLGEHHYALTATWTGNRGTGTSGYRDYDRSVSLRIEGKPEVLASADVAFRGDGARWNPEDLLLAALSECHLLSYLHACVVRGVVVTSYVDDAVGTMRQQGNGGRYESVTLRPRVTVADASMVEDARAAHDDAHEWCFIANSVNFPVHHEAEVSVG